MYASLFDESLGLGHISECINCVRSPNTILVAINSTHFYFDSNAPAFGSIDNVSTATYAALYVMKRCINHD